MVDHSPSMSLAAVMRRVRLDRASWVLAAVVLAVSVGMVAGGRSLGTLDGLLLQVLGVGGVWLVVASLALLVGLRWVGVRERSLAKALVVVHGGMWTGCIFGFGALIGCKVLGWDGAVGFPLFALKFPTAYLVVVACWSSVFACAITRWSDRPWGDVPRVAALPAGLSVLGWFGVLTILLPAGVEQAGPFARATEGVALVRAIDAHRARHGVWPERLADLSDVTAERVQHHWSYYRDPTGWTLSSTALGYSYGRVQYSRLAGVASEWRWYRGRDLAYALNV